MLPRNTVGRAGTFAVAVLALVISAALPSHAAGNQNGSVDYYEFGFYYNSSTLGYGSVSDFAYAQANLTGYKFLTYGPGKGQYVKNNAAASYNRSPDYYARVYYNSNFAGKYDTIDRLWKGNLIPALKNENASFAWIR